MKGVKGITSKQFVNMLENKGSNKFGDMNVMQMSEEEFKKLAMSSGRVSNFTRKLKKMGYTDFSTAWGTKIIVNANVKASQLTSLMEMMQGGISDSEQAKLNSMIKAKGRKNLEYIG